MYTLVFVLKTLYTTFVFVYPLRPRACDLLKHTLMVEARPETVLSMLVARTKDAVRRLDNKNYRAARKIFMLNNHNGVS